MTARHGRSPPIDNTHVISGIAHNKRVNVPAIDDKGTKKRRNEEGIGMATTVARLPKKINSRRMYPTGSVRSTRSIALVTIVFYVLCGVWLRRSSVLGSGSGSGSGIVRDQTLGGFALYLRSTSEATSRRLQDQIATVRGFSDDPYPAVTRVLFTENDVKARAYVKTLMADAGLEVTVDGMGSIIGSWRVGGVKDDDGGGGGNVKDDDGDNVKDDDDGNVKDDDDGNVKDDDGDDGGDTRVKNSRDGSGRNEVRTRTVVMTGSHTDAIPLAGAYDGVVGVLGGIEAIRLLREYYLNATNGSGDDGGAVEFQAIMFASEEPTRFGLSCVASRVYGGVLDRKGVDGLRDGNGMGFVEAAKEAGVSVDVEGARATYQRAGSPRRVFVELHIEQGKELEDDGLDIGIVTHIAGPSSLIVSFEGPGGHAGGLLMRDRHDASLAAAELALDVEKLVKREASIDTVGTVGSWTVSPNAVNSVPRKVVLGIDVRDIDSARLARVLDGVRARAGEIAEKRGVTYEIEVTNHDRPATSSVQVVDAVGAAAGALGLRSKKMVSRAYHDSLFMSLVSDMGMIFIPCEGGKSHRPDEFASERDILHGVQTLATTMGQVGGLLKDNTLHRGGSVERDTTGENHQEL